MKIQGKFEFKLAPRSRHNLAKTWDIVKVEGAKIMYMQHKFDFQQAPRLCNIFNKTWHIVRVKAKI